MTSQYELEKRISQLESDVRQLRQLLKTSAPGDNEVKPEQKRKPGRPRNEQATNRSD